MRKIIGCGRRQTNTLCFNGRQKNINNQIMYYSGKNLLLLSNFGLSEFRKSPRSTFELNKKAFDP